MAKLRQTRVQETGNESLMNVMPDNPGVSKKLEAWRRKQPEGAIMKPATFEKIKRSAAARGARDPEAVAGKAYWEAARAKYRKARKK